MGDLRLGKPRGEAEVAGSKIARKLRQSNVIPIIGIIKVTIHFRGHRGISGEEWVFDREGCARE